MQLLVLFLAVPALANLAPAGLLKRQSDCVGAGYKTCGDGCIPITWTCCPKEDGGCPASSYCDIGDNGETACCLNGFQCTGDGGVSTDYNTYTSFIPSTIEETSTIVEDTTTYSASLPILTLTTETETETATETESSSVPPVDLPSPIPSGNGTTTAEPTAVPTAGANVKALAGNLVGGVAAGAAMLLI